MIDDQTFERNARAWLEMGPAHVPQRLIDAALRTIAVTPQQRTFRRPRRRQIMVTQPRLAMAAVVGAIAITGGLLFFNRTPPLIGKPTATPHSSEPSASPTATLSPGETPVGDQIQIGSGWLVFERHQQNQVGAGVDVSIWAVHQDGSDLHEIAPEIDGKQSPDISPDGSTVAFETAGNILETEGGQAQIWTAPIDGGPAGVVYLQCPAESLCDDTNPAYSPDGSALAFVRNGSIVGWVDLRTGDVSLLSATEHISGPAPDGTNTTAQVGRPSWSIKGEIAYQLTTRKGTAQPVTTVDIVNRDNTNPRSADAPAGIDVGDPHWSPDGTRILMSSESDRYNATPASVALYTASSDGGEFYQLCAAGACGIDASWTPDGHAIIFWREGTWWAMDTHSAHQRPINQALDSLSSVDAGAFVVRLAPDFAGASPAPSEPIGPPIAIGDLNGAWASVGARRVLDASGPADLSFTIDATSLRIYTWRGEVLSSVSSGDAGSVDLTLANPEADLAGLHLSCHNGDLGHYAARLSPNGQTLTLAALNDSCAPRAAMVAGEWTRWPCPDPTAFSYCSHVNELVAGPQTLPNFRPFDSGKTGQLSYVAPSGWADVSYPPTWEGRNSATWGSLSLIDTPDARDIALYSEIRGQSDLAQIATGTRCITTAPLSNDATDVADWLESLDTLVTSDRQTVSVGDLTGVQIDVAPKTGVTDPCDIGQPVPLFLIDPQDNGDYSGQVSLDSSTSDQARFILLDAGSGNLMLIVVQAPGLTAWNSLLAQTMPVIDTFQFIRETQ